MIGIQSYGAYIPRLRLSRMAIFQAMGWFAPATIMVAQGERSMCNHDEDSLTMAVAAARDCLTGMDKRKIDGSYLCSTTLPFADRQNAGILKTALNLRDDMITADFTSSLRAGTTGLLTALDVVQGGSRKQILVSAADKRETKPAYFYEMWFGDGAASLLVGSEDVIAEFKGSYTVSYDFVDHYRGAGKAYDYMWEERWLREEAYSKFIPEAVGGLMKKLGITMNDVQKIVFPCLFKAEHRAIAKTAGRRPGEGDRHDARGVRGDGGGPSPAHVRRGPRTGEARATGSSSPDSARGATPSTSKSRRRSRNSPPAPASRAPWKTRRASTIT